jgi:spermidine synthase
VYSLFFLSGATGLIYEVLWFKLLKLQFGSLTSTAAFLFAVFLLGLALGASYTDRWLRREKKEQRYLLWYALAELGIGLYALFTLLLIPWVGKLHLLYNHGITAPWMATLDLGLFAIVLLPPTVLG